MLRILCRSTQAVMTAEMSSLISDNGGYVVWAQAAFGDLAGLLAGVNGIVSSWFDLALFPALIADYAGEFKELSTTEVHVRAGCACGCVVVAAVMMIVNCTGIRDQVCGGAAVPRRGVARTAACHLHPCGNHSACCAAIHHLLLLRDVRAPLCDEFVATDDPGLVARAASPCSARRTTWRP